MDRYKHDGSVQKPKISTCVFENINERLSDDSSAFWDGGTGRETPLVNTFTTSIYLAAPPPSHMMKTAAKQFTVSPRYPTLSETEETSLSYSTPFNRLDPPVSQFDRPSRSLTTSFYMSTGVLSQEQQFRVTPLASNTSSRTRYNSTGSASPSSTDSGTVSFDFSLPSQATFFIDTPNISPKSEENSIEMIFNDSGYNSQRSVIEQPSNQMASVCKIDLNSNQSQSSFLNQSVNQSQHSFEEGCFNPPSKSSSANKSKMFKVKPDQSEMRSFDQTKTVYRRPFDQSYRRASFEIHSTPSIIENTCKLTNKEKPFSRRHSLYIDQSALSQGKFSIDDDINANQYRDYPENILVDLLKKCTDFPERRRIRSALRNVRENQKSTVDTKGERSTFFIPFQESTNVNPTSVSMATVRLSPREVNQGQITPVLTSTPRDIDLFMLKDIGEVLISEQTEQVQHPENQACESNYHFEISSGNSVSEDSHSESEESDEDKTQRKISSKSQGAKSISTTTTTTTRRPSSQTNSSQSSKSSGTSTEASAGTRTQKSAVKVPIAASRETTSTSSEKLRPKSGEKPKDTVTISRRTLPNKETVLAKKITSIQRVPPSNVSRNSSEAKVKSEINVLTRSEVKSPRRKLPDTKNIAAKSQTSNPSRVSPRPSSAKQTESANTSSSCRPKSNKTPAESRNKKSTSSKQVTPEDSGVVIVKTPTENIVIPKIVISDLDDPIVDDSNPGNFIETSKIADYTKDNDSKEKRKYYRKKQRPTSLSDVDCDAQLSRMSTIVTMGTRSEVIDSDGPMKIDLENNNNKTESSQGEAELEKAFTDLLDNFEKNSETVETKSVTQTDMNKTNITKNGAEIISENNNTFCGKSKSVDSLLIEEKMLKTAHSPYQHQSEKIAEEKTLDKGVVDNSLASLAAIEEEAFSVDRLGDVQVEESDDGALTVTDVQEFDQGQRKVSVTTTKKRTDSEAEYQDKETTIVTTFQSPSGTKYEEEDVIKTRRKLTPKGSIYIKKDTVRKKRAFCRSGEQTVEEDHVVETENKSVSQGRSWGDKTLTTTVLSKPTKADRTIHSIQEEATSVKPIIENEETVSKTNESSGIPDIIQALADQQVMVGTSATLQCQGTSIAAPEVTWYSGKSVVTETAYFKPAFDGTKATLTITEVFPDDEGMYRCAFKNAHGTAETTCQLFVKAPRLEDVPSIREALDDVEVTPGDSVTLKCGFKGVGDIIWHKEGTRIKETSRLKIQVQSGIAELTIKDATLDDAGQYSCSVKNSAGEASTICQITVAEVGCPPDILNPLFNCTATVGKSFKLLCRISGEPPPSVKWLHNGRELLETSSCKPSYKENIARLELKSVVSSDKGSYECVGANSLGSASTSCELNVKDESSSTRASIQLNMSSVSKSVDNSVNSDFTDGVRRLEASQSLDISINQSNSSTKDLDIYSRGIVRSCTPPPQVRSCTPPPQVRSCTPPPQVRSCSPPKSLEIQTCSPPSAKMFNPRSPLSVPRENGSRSSTLTRSQSLKVNGEMNKTSAVNRLQNFFGSVMTNNNNSSPNPFSRSPSEEQQIETKSSFIVRKRDNFSDRSSGISLDLTPSPSSPSQVAGGGADSFGDLSTLHRDIIMSAKIAEMEDEAELHKLMDTAENFEERKMIRARLKELREKARADWEAKRKEREAAVVDVVKLKQQRADEDKKKRMAGFQARAETSGKDSEDKHLMQTQKDLVERQKFADDEKQKKLDAYNKIARTGSGVSETRTTTSRQSTDNDAKSSTTTTTKQSTTDNDAKSSTTTTTKQSTTGDGKSTTTTTTKTVSIQQQGFGGSSYGTPAPKAATKPPGARGAMAAFKQMDTLNPAAPAKPKWGGGSGGATTTGGGGGSKVVRNPSAIKQMLLDWCKAMTQEYENVSVTNFSSCWNNGMAFCALIHHFYPDSFDFSKLDPKQRRKNFNLAFDTAEKEADIAPLLDVEDMVRMQKPDWKCVFCYVQSFYRHLRNHPNCKQIVPPS